MRQKANWTDAMVRKLIHLRAVEKMSWPKIARELNITTGAASSKFCHLMGRHNREAGKYEPSPRKVALEPAEARRGDYLAALDRRTLTQVMFGDPPPGYSALDRTRAAEALR